MPTATEPPTPPAAPRHGLRAALAAAHGLRAALAALLILGPASACTVVQGVPGGPPGVTGAGQPVDGAAAPSGTVPGRVLALEDEIRGVWVVRTTLTSPEGIRRMVRRTHEAGINTLLVQLRGRADAWYPSALEPAPPQAPAGWRDFDPLDLLIREARARGMTVHGWVVAQLVWGVGPLPSDPDHLVNRHPEWLAVPRELARELWSVDPADPRYRARIHRWAVENRERVEGMFASPGHPGPRDRLVAVVRDLVTRYDLDGVHLDYIRYPSPEFDYSRSAVEAFADWARRRTPPGRASSMDARMRSGDVDAWPRENPGLWDGWRETQVTTTLRAVSSAARAADPDVLVSAAVFADPVDALRGRFQDWPEWLAGGWVDAVAPMAYTDDAVRFADLVELARRADGGDGSRIWPGVGIYRTDLPGAARQVELARAAGTAGFVLFSYDWAEAEADDGAGGPYLDALARQAFPEAVPGG